MLKKVAKKVLGKPSSPLANYQYFIDVIDTDSIAGWAKNNSSAKAPNISVYSGEKKLWQGIADLARDDLADAGIGEYAFHIVPDVSVLDGDITHIDIYIDGHKVNELPYPYKLSNSFESTTIQARAEETYSNVIEDSICQIDAVTSTLISGWAKSKSNDKKRLNIEFRNDDKVLASGLADTYREDLINAGIGDGQYGFKLDFNLTQFESEQVAAELFIDGVPIGGDAFIFTVDLSDIEKAKFNTQFSEQFAAFEKMTAEELNRINEQITTLSQNSSDQSMNVAMNVVVQNIAEISARMSVIEKVLLNKLAED